MPKPTLRPTHPSPTLKPTPRPSVLAPRYHKPSWYQNFEATPHPTSKSFDATVLGGDNNPSFGGGQALRPGCTPWAGEEWTRIYDASLGPYPTALVAFVVWWMLLVIFAEKKFAVKRSKKQSCASDCFSVTTCLGALAAARAAYFVAILSHTTQRACYELSSDEYPHVTLMHFAGQWLLLMFVLRMFKVTGRAGERINLKTRGAETSPAFLRVVSWCRQRPHSSSWHERLYTASLRPDTFTITSTLGSFR